MDIKTIADSMNTIISKETLIKEFESNKTRAAIAWGCVMLNRQSNRMHESGVSMEAFHLARYYSILDENETIAAILKELGMREYWKEVMSAAYSRNITMAYKEV